MKYPAYPDYKASGVEWLGEVPAHWETEPFKYATNFINGMAFKPETWATEGTPIIRIENLNGGDNFNCFEGHVPAKYHVNKGDLLFGWSGNRGTSFGPFLWWRDGLHYLNQHIFKLLEYPCHKVWFYWCLRAVTRTIEDEAHGIIGMVHVTRGKLGSVAIPKIPLGEQKAIADFLDRETAKLDALVAKKRTLVERLKEKRAALISRTVTRGLPPDVARDAGLETHCRLKTSSIDWLGEVPEHWEVVPLGRLVQFAGGATPDKGKPEYWDGDIPWVSPKDMKRMHITDVPDHISPEGLNNSPLKLLPVRSILIVVRGMILAHSFPVAITEVPVTINQDMKALAAGERLEPAFLLWALTGLARVFVSLADESAHGTRKLESEIIARVFLALPPVSEQATIADFLDCETAKIDTMAAKVELAIERLQEYRAAFISAAVTGKIDVRESISMRDTSRTDATIAHV